MFIKTVINPYILESTGGGFTNDKRIDLNGTDQRCYTNTRWGSAAALGAFSVWVEKDATTQQTIVAMNADPSNNDDYWYIRFNSDELQVIIRDSDTALFNRNTSGLSLTTGTKYHIFGQMTTGGIDIRVNDSAVSWNTGTGSLTTQHRWFDIVNSDGPDVWDTDGRCYLGGFRVNASNTNWLNGKLDEVAFFDDNLTNTEITNIYNSGTPDDLTGHDHLVEWYRFEDDATDEVGSNDLTLEGSPSYVTA